MFSSYLHTTPSSRVISPITEPGIFSDILERHQLLKSNLSTLNSESTEYKTIEESLRKQEESIRNYYASLGSVSSKDDYYFDDTEESNDLARAFLYKFAAELKKFNITVIKEMAVIFALIEINGKSTCLISPSISSNQNNLEMRTALQSAAKEFGEDFFYVATTHDFNTITTMYTERKGLEIETRPCGENLLSLYLRDQLKIHGNAMKILAMSNFRINSIQDKTSKSRRDLGQALDYGIFHAINIPCCKICRKLKTTVMGMLKEHQINGESPRSALAYIDELIPQLLEEKNEQEREEKLEQLWNEITLNIQGFMARTAKKAISKPTSEMPENGVTQDTLSERKTEIEPLQEISAQATRAPIHTATTTASPPATSAHGVKRNFGQSTLFSNSHLTHLRSDSSSSSSRDSADLEDSIPSDSKKPKNTHEAAPSLKLS